MSYQETQQIAASAHRASFGKNCKFAAGTATIIVMVVFAVGTAAAAAPAENVNVVNTPTVHVGNTPSVTVANTPSVNVANTPAVSISGTPTVNANATIAAPGPLTNVGRLASQQVMLLYAFGGCPTNWFQVNADGSFACFDISSYPEQVLIITDVTSLASGTAGNTCLTSLTTSGSAGAVFLRTGAVAAADTYAIKSEHLTTGAKMTVNPVVGTGCTLLSYEMTGYLVPNQ